jgi:tetratricopeptide (TPR) repeat protein
MRRTALLALLLALPALGCASFQSYRDLTPEPAPALTASAASAEADALLARFYGADGAVDPKALAAARAAAPGHSGLAEIAGYGAILRADPHDAFEHFLAAAADRSALSPELYLWEMRGLAHTTTEHLRAQALLRTLSAQHPRPPVRQLAAYDLARELRLVGEREEAEQIVGTLGFVPSWQVVGAFDNDQGKGYSTEYPPEQNADLGATYPGLRLPVRFRPMEASKLDGALPLGEVIWPVEAAVAYAQTFVFADAARQVDLRLTTTNGVRVWVNGKLLASDEKIFREELDNVIVRLSLAPGWNRVLVKSAHLTGAWRLAARFTDAASGEIARLRTAATATVPAGATAQGTMVSPMGPVERLADANRKRFLLGRMWAREGHTQRSSHFFDPLLRDVPKNPLAMYFSALSFWDNAEVGKALDLLNDGVTRHRAAPAFQLKRGRFYGQRKLWDKAQKDLEAVLAQTPAARDAAFELATVFAGRGWPIDRCQQLEAILAKWPDDSPALGDLGQCKVELRYLEDAERLLRRAHALTPGREDPIQRLVSLAEERLDYDGAAAWLRELQAAQPSSMDYLLQEAELHRRAGRPEDAARVLERARALSPDAPAPYDKLAQLAYEARRRPDAERWWRLALERDPDNASLAQHVASLSPSAPSLSDRLVPSGDDIDRAVRSAEKVKPHSGSQLAVLMDDEVTTVNPDGSSKRVVTHVAQAFNTDGRDALISARLPQSGKLTVLEAYSVSKSGERQEASSISAGNVRFRSLDVGSITVLQYVHYAPAAKFLPNEYVETWNFQVMNAQVESSRWRLVLPRERALNVELRGPVESTSEVQGEQKVWTFSAHAVPPLVPEPGMTAPTDHLSMATVSTVKSWDAYVHWETALLSDAFSASAEIDALAKKLTADAKTTREKIDRLWGYVAQEIRYQQEYETTIAGVKPHSAGVVRERGYGDCKDKAVLLIRLAKAVGVHVQFALLRTTPYGKVLKQIPNQQFNHAIAYVPKQAGIEDGFFVDTTTNGLDIGNARTDDEGATSLVVDVDSGKWEFLTIPYQSAELEYMRHRVKVDLSDPSKAIAHDHYEAKGWTAQSLRVAMRNKENAKKFYQSLSDKLFAGTTLVSGKSEHDQDLTRPAALDLEIDLNAAVQPEDDRYRLDLPLFFPIGHSVTLTERKLPLALWRGVQSFELDADLGDKNELFHAPPDFEVKHACFSIERKSEVKGHHLTVKSTYRNTCAEIAPADYPAFRAAVQKAVARSQDNLVFGAKGKGGAPAKKAAK